MRPSKLLLLSLGLVGLLAACSSAPKNTQAMTQAEAKTTSEAALNDLSLSGALVGGFTGLTAQSQAAAQSIGMPLQAASVLESLGMNVAQAITVGCTLDWSPQIPTDADKDGVPADLTVTVDCTYTDSGSGFTYAFKGSLKIQDTNDALKNSGFRLALQNWSEKATKGSDSFERTFDGTYSIDTQNPALFKEDKGYTAAQNVVLSGQTDSASAQYGVSTTYTPDDPTKPKAAGLFEIKEANPGSLTLTHNAKTYSWKWNTKPTLHYNASCKARTPKGVRIPFDRGGAFYSYTNPDGSVATLEIQFTGCNAYTIIYNGNQPITP